MTNKMMEIVNRVNDLRDKYNLSNFDFLIYCQQTFRRCANADDDYCLKSRFCVDCKFKNVLRRKK